MGRLARLVRNVLRLSALGERLSDRTRIAFAVLLAPLRRRLGGPPRTLRLQLDLPHIGRRAWSTGSDADLKVLAESLVDREYDVPVEAHTILDLGGHVGASVLFFHHRYPEARIIVLEPDPMNFRRLVANVGDLSRVELHPIAATGRDGPVTLHSAAHDSWATSLVDTRPGWTRAVTVQGRRLDGFLADNDVERVDLLKIDIEGGEYEVLPSFKGLGKVRAVVGEVHPTAEYDFGSIRAVLADFDSDLPAKLDGARMFRAIRRAP